MRLLVASCLLLLVSAKSVAAVDEDVQLWLPVTWTASLMDPVQGFFEVQPRIGDNVSDVTQLLLRTALGYRFTPEWSGWLGYAFTPTLSPTETDESRLFQQLSFAHSYPIARLTSRTRLEQRWIEGVSGTAVRLRTMLRGVVPFTEDKLWGVALQDEIFFNLNSPDSTGPQAGFDQNRFFLGINRVIDDKVNIDAGYMIQFIDTANGSPDRLNHILVLQLYLNS